MHWEKKEFSIFQAIIQQKTAPTFDPGDCIVWIHYLIASVNYTTRNYFAIVKLEEEENFFYLHQNIIWIAAFELKLIKQSLAA